LEFFTKFYRANFFHGLRMRNKWGTRKTGPDRPAEQGGPAGPDRPAQGGSDGGSPRFSPGTCLFDFLLWSENFKGSLKKGNAVLGHSFSDYLIGRIGS
jgi:hypothetical protein